MRIRAFSPKSDPEHGPFFMKQLIAMQQIWHVMLAVALFGATTAAHATTNHGLRAIHAVTSARHSDVEHMSRDGLAAALKADADTRDILILDVREAHEYAVSHIPGALRISPEITATHFQQKFANKLKGRQVVLYCSVGVRSTKLASRIRKSAIESGAKSVANLTGGIFGWHNEGRRLQNADGSTELVHPYNSFWSTLIERDALISFGAEPTNSAPSGTSGPANP